MKAKQLNSPTQNYVQPSIKKVFDEFHSAIIHQDEMSIDFKLTEKQRERVQKVVV
jgi:hypothetical protein